MTTVVMGTVCDAGKDGDLRLVIHNNLSLTTLANYQSLLDVDSCYSL